MLKEAGTDLVFACVGPSGVNPEVLIPGRPLIASVPRERREHYAATRRPLHPGGLSDIGPGQTACGATAPVGSPRR